MQIPPPPFFPVIVIHLVDKYPDTQMSSIKIYPPQQLPNEGVTDVQFSIWREELEVYLECENKFRKFLPGGTYDNWKAAEENEKRIISHKAPDTADSLPDIRRDLRQFIVIVAKYIHQDYYNPIIRHSTSLEWIFKKIREDFDIQQQGIHFLNLLDLSYDATGQTTPIGFYNQYRSMVIGNLAKKDTKIQWKNETLKEDEKLTASHEDLILLNVLMLIHPKLPGYIREQYSHRMGEGTRIMDFKTEILSKCKQYINEINGTTSTTSDTEDSPQCNYMSTNRGSFRGNNRQQHQQRRYQQPNSFQRQRPTAASSEAPPFCRVCHLQGLSRTVYTSHYLGQQSCPSLSSKDKQMLTTRIGQQLNALSLEEDDDDIIKEYGYTEQDSITQPIDEIQVNKNINGKIFNYSKELNLTDIQHNSNFSTTPNLNYIMPVPTQTLTVTDANNKPCHLDIDSGATVSYAKHSTVIAHGFQIRPNSQLSNLADGHTKLESIGEIKETFYRNNWSVTFHAIVTRNLHCDFVAGTNFMKENSVIQDITSNSITVHKKYTVSETSKSLILPTQPNNLLLQNSHLNVILPNKEIEIKVPYKDDTLLAVQPWHQNKSQEWPEPQICSVSNGQIKIKNQSKEPIILKKSNKVQVRTLSDNTTNPQFFNMDRKLEEKKDQDNTGNIEINEEDVDPEILRYVKDINHTYKDVFNNDLSVGYNHRFGKHIVELNWASPSRPPASKVQNINYDFETKKLLQEVCDDLTQKGVLAIPQDYNVNIQYCSPSFLVRKQKAKNKAKNELSVEDVRLVVNFSKLNGFLKNMPTIVTKPKDIFSQLGKWNFIITLDLQSGFFQNHMSMTDAEWLGITTPFGGTRFLKRSGQGLIGQSEELDELLSKILGPEMKEGKVARIADDIYVGGRTQMETINNYRDVLQKFQASNIKISASKTKVFLKSVDILGWIWKQGGYLSPSPHRVNALKNTKHTDINNVKDLRSYIGLYKTLLPASPNLTLILNPFDIEVSDRESKDLINWNRDLISKFQEATAALDNLQTLYLPAPEDQLLIECDAAKSPPGLGHTVYAIINQKKIPVAFHSVKLSENHQKWMACELEALAFSCAINAEYELLKECKKPIIISPDSKTVADAVKKIQKGHYSASPRIQSLITNINRIPIIVQLASGKTNQNVSSDYQSRHPSKCETQHCSICNFVNDTSDSVLLPSINNIEPDKSMNNKKAWNDIQDQQKPTKEAKYLIKSGKTPSKVSGKIQSEIRRLCTIAKLTKENLLIVESQPNKFSSVKNELIVIPQSHLPALLWQLHNKLQHPSKSQLKSNFDKSFYSVGLTAAMENLYNDCFYCCTQKKIPDISYHQTLTDVTAPGLYFHGDVIRRQSQYIFIARDHFSSYTSAKIIKSESHKELKEAIISTILPLKLSGKCTLKVDNATGFVPLLNNKDPDLEKLQIKIVQTDQFNKNANAVVDKGCFEIEQELKRVEPDGRPISNTTLQIAITRLNEKLRRKGQISSYEIHFNRDMHTGTSLNLNYEKIRREQIETRNLANQKHNSSLPIQIKQNPQPGDIVTAADKYEKHKAKNIYMVAETNDQKVTIQKILHPHSKNPTIRAKQYITTNDRIHVTKSFQNRNVISKSEKKQSKPIWNPVREIPRDDDDDDVFMSNDEKNHQKQYQAFIRPQTTENIRPQLYQSLDKEIENQRIQASHELKRAKSLENVNKSSNTPRTSSRAQNIAAKQKISSIYNKKAKIPQTDGLNKDSDSPLSTSPCPVKRKTRLSSTTENFLDGNVDDNRSETSEKSSIEWDYSDMNEHLDTDDIFPQQPLDDSFMNPPLNLTATNVNVDTNRVYDFTSLLTTISSTVRNISGLPHPEVDNKKKGDANH